MSPYKKQLTVWRISYLIYSAVVDYARAQKIGLIIIELDSGEQTAYRRDTNYLKTVHDLQTKIHE